MTDDEVNAYYALLATDEEAAERYMKAMMKTLTERNAEYESNLWASIATGQSEQLNNLYAALIAEAENNPTIGNRLKAMGAKADQWADEKVLPKIAGVASMALEPLKLLGSAKTILSAVTGQDIDPNDPVYFADMAQSAIREAQKKEIEENSETTFGKNAKLLLYDLVMALGDNMTRVLPAKALGLGAKGATLLSSAGAFGGSARGAVENGANTTQAVMKAGADVLAEYITERLPMENIFKALDGTLDAKGWKGILQIGLSGLEEGVGEGLSEILSAEADKLMEHFADISPLR
jgi:hypothetical protein